MDGGKDEIGEGRRGGKSFSDKKLAPRIQIAQDNDSEIFCVRFSPDSSMIAAGCGDGVIRIFNPTSPTGNLVYQLQTTGKLSKLPVTSLRWRPQSKQHKTRNVLLATYAEGSVRHWHVHTMKVLHHIEEENNQIYIVDYSPDATKFATAGKDYKVRLYDENTKQMVSALTGGHGDVTAGHANRVFSLKFKGDDDNILLTGGWDNTVQIWDSRVDHAVRSIFGPHICGDAVDVYKDVVVTGSWRPENQLQVWDFGSGKLVDDINWRTAVGEEPCLLYCAEFSKNDAASLIAAGGSGSNEAKVFDRMTGNPIGTIAGMNKGVYSVDFNNDGSMFAVAGGDSSIRLLNLV